MEGIIITLVIVLTIGIFSIYGTTPYYETTESKTVTVFNYLKKLNEKYPNQHIIIVSKLNRKFSIPLSLSQELYYYYLIHDYETCHRKLHKFYNRTYYL